MTPISLRLPDEIEAKLALEAQAQGTSRSEIARQAIVEYLDRREKARFMADMVKEMRQGYGEPAICRKALGISAEADTELDAIIKAERVAGIDPAEKWWR